MRGPVETQTPETSQQPANLVEQIGTKLEQYESEWRQDTLADRLAQLLEIQRANLFYKGKQYLRKSFSAGTGEFSWQPIDEPQDGRVMFRRVENIIRADGAVYANIIRQRKTSNQEAVAIDQDDPTYVRKARAAGMLARHLVILWRIRHRIDKEVGKLLWTDGQCYAYVNFVVNRAKYGVHREDVYTPQPVPMPGTIACRKCLQENPEGASVCSQCQNPLAPEDLKPGPMVDVPVKTDTKEYDKGMPEVEFLSGLNVEVEFGAKSLDETPFLAYTTPIKGEHARRALLRRLAKRAAVAPVNEDSASSTTSPESEMLTILERLASPSGEQRQQHSQVSAYTRKWYRPDAYDAMEPSLAQTMAANFKDGALAHYLDGKLLYVEADKLDDHWAAITAGTDGASLTGPGACEGSMDDQVTINRLGNLGIETIVRGLPKTIVDSAVLNRETAKKAEARVAEILFTHTGGLDLSKATAIIPSARMPDGLPMFKAEVRESGRERSRITQQLFGAGPTDTTWRAANQRKQAGLAQFEGLQEDIAWELIGKALTLGIKLAARFGLGELIIAPESSRGFNSATKLDMRSVAEDGWKLEPRENSPMTLGEKLENLSGLATEAPDLAQATGLYDRSNRRMVKTLFGVEGFTVPGEFDFDNVLDRIQELLSGQVIPQFDPITGQQFPQSSIPINPFEDRDHSFIADTMREWCNSPAGRQAKMENPAGYANVVAHGTEQQAAADAMMMQQAAMQGPEQTPPPA